MGADPLMAAVEEQLLARLFASSRPAGWLSVHRALSLPLLRHGNLVERTGQLGGRSWSVVCCGRPKRFQWLLAQLFDEVGPTHGSTRRPTTDPSAFDHLAADLVAVEVHPSAAPRFREAGWIVAPESIRWIRGVDDPHLLARTKKGRGLRSDLALIAQMGYTMEEGGTRADWDLFRDQMLLPYAQSRFGDHAWKPSPGFLRVVAARGRILFASRDGQRVSGTCAVPAGRRVWTPLLGVLGGRAELLQQGAVAALYKFLLEWAAQRGAEGVDVGRTRPSLSDSIAWYKSKWGFRPTPDPLAHLVAVRLGPGKATLEARFASRRILIQEGNGLGQLGVAALATTTRSPAGAPVTKTAPPAAPPAPEG